MIRLDAATVLLQWSVGGLAFLWVTTRGRLLGIGYGWLMRAIFIAFALGSIAAGLAVDTVAVREASAVGVVVASSVALAVSIARRKAGVSAARDLSGARQVRVAAMLDKTHPATRDTTIDDQLVGAEFPPVLDVIAPVIGVIGLVAAGWADARTGAAGTHLLSVTRVIVGAAFLGSVTDAMLLGHWYLVQPGLPRAPLFELNTWVARIWPLEVLLLLIPTGMFSVFSGSIDDGYGGMLGWFWIACAVTTIVLCFVTNAALKERSYSAVMAATGLLYLAILTAFGTDLVARAV
ncbi:MAG: hypothetical protein H0U92_07410, partial [Actinobacteria bacterium]|nr:hypothetical protein [Actinomycetota bacterium]